MRKEEKLEIINAISAQLEETPNFYITDIAGLNAEKTHNLRKACFEAGVKLVVTKNTLFTKVLETEDKEEALMDLARLYERMVMRRHTNGGYQNVVDEMWRQVEDWRAEIIIMYQNVACKNMATLQGILDDTCRDRNHHMIWIEHDLMDPRTVSRKTMRDKVNEYMRTVMKAEPVDPTLCDFDDELGM